MRNIALALIPLLLLPASAEEPAVLREFEPVRAEYIRAWQAQTIRVRKAKSEADFKALEKTRPDVLFIPRILALAEKYAADPAAVVPALHVLRSDNSPDGKSHERARAILIKHAGSKYITPAIPTLTGQDEETALVLKTVLKSNPDPRTQARAGRLLRSYLDDINEKATEANLDSEYREKLEKQTSAKYVERLIARLHENRRELVALNALLSGKLAKILPDFSPGLPMPDLTLTDLAGKKQALRDMRSKILLIHVFSVERNRPDWLYSVQQNRWAEEFKDRPIVRINISIDERKETFADWLRHYPLSDINVWAGRDSDLFAEWYGDHQREQTFLVSADGMIRIRSSATNDMHGPIDQKIQDLFADMKVPARPEPATPKVHGAGLTEAARSYEQLRLDFQHAGRRYERAILMARNDDDKRQASEGYSWQTFGTRALELAEKHIDDPASFDLLSFRVRHHANTSEEEYTHAVFLLAKHYAASPRMIELIRPKAFGMIGQPLFLKKVLEKNPDRTIQARASRMLKEFYERQAGGAERYLQADLELQRAIRRRCGEDYIKELLDSMKSNQELRTRYVKLDNEKYAKVLPEIAVGKPMLDAEMTGLDGKKFKLSDLRGKIVYLNIISAEEHRPTLSHQRELAERLKGKPFVIVNLSVDERAEVFAEYLRRDPTPWVNAWIGRRSEVYADWMPSGHESSYLIDSKGVLRNFGAGWADLPDLADGLLAELAVKGALGQ